MWLRASSPISAKLATLLAQVRQGFLHRGGWPTHHSTCGCDYRFLLSLRWRQLRGAMDATRVRDNLHVMLKRVFPAEGPHELRINKLFSSPELATMPDNHC